MLVSGTGSGSGGMRLLCGLGLGSADVWAFTLCGRVFLYLGLTALLDYKTLNGSLLLDPVPSTWFLLT